MANSDLSTRSDLAVLAELGARAERTRVARNLSQLELAQRAGVGKRTIERLEAGESTTTLNLVRILRALDLLPELTQVFPDQATPSPMAQLRDARRERRRASPRRAPDGDGRGPARRAERKGAPFPWGEPEPPS